MNKQDAMTCLINSICVIPQQIALPKRDFKNNKDALETKCK